MTESIRDLLARPPGGEPLTVRGWIKTARDSKNVVFLELSDGSCLRGLQGVIDKTSGDFPLDRLSTGTAVEVRGRLCPSAGAKQEVELAVQSLTVLGDCPPDFPLQKKRHSFEYLREIAHLRPRTNTFGAVCRVRSRLSYAIHRFFQDRGFFYIHTPIISASDCEGAGQMFSVTALDLSSPPRTPEGGVDYGEDFFGKPARLTVSGQLEAETLALALKNVYTFGPTFRAEKSSTTRHLAEFWMVEPEMAFCDIALNQ
ncbi:MAG: asparagine--tRNA ligase, partial [Spirochaetales bacterium]|nr:asparagine--tRNA ligase [Spirochaetales bacterium]